MKKYLLVVCALLALGGCNLLPPSIGEGTTNDNYAGLSGDVADAGDEADSASGSTNIKSGGDKGLQILLCLEDSGAKMYGSITCGHCSNQKKSLGAAAEAEFGRVYIECNPQAENSRMWDCMEAKIEAYPTWIFGDGNLVRGFTEPARLQELSGCTDDVLEKY